MAQLLVLQVPWQHQLCRDTDCLHGGSYGPIRVSSRASCSWQSEGFFGQSFSVAPPIQALRGLPCLGSYSVDRSIRHLEGPPGWGPTLLFSVLGVLWASLYIVQVGCGEREATGMAPPPIRDLAVLPCFHGCLAFLHRRFSPQSPPSHPLSPSVCSQQHSSP